MSLVIPDDINDRSPLEQVMLFRRYGDVVFPIDPPGRNRNGKTLPKSSKKQQLDDNELYHSFGNGNHFNVGLKPANGHIIVNLDAADKDRRKVEDFINSNPALAEVPRVQTARGHHLHFLSDNSPGNLLKLDVVPGVNLQLITSEGYVVAPPSLHEQGTRYLWVVTGEVPSWSPEIAAAFNISQEPSAAPPTTTQRESDGEQEATPPVRRTILNKPRVDLVPGFSNLAAMEIFTELDKDGRYFQQDGKLVHYDKNSVSGRLSIVSPDQFRSLLDKHFEFRKPRVKDPGSPADFHPATATREDAALILGSKELSKSLKHIARVVKHPVLIAEGNEPKILTTGAHDGIFIDSADIIPDVPVEEAVSSIHDLFRDFKFNTPHDLSRAVGHFLSPAMVFGDLLLNGRVPVHVVQADQPGSGKGFMQKLILTIYGEEPGIVTSITRGVGGIEEILSKRLLDGFAFIQWDNLRGKLYCEMFESATTEDTASCRTLHISATVSTKGVFFMITSNGVELSPDLADRSVFVRIIKQDDEYQWSTYGDGSQELSEYVKTNRTYYLGCIYSILSEWIRQGKPKNQGRHRFHQWAGSMDWIVRNLFHLPPLLNGHKEVQREVASPIFVFLRAAAIQVEKEGMLGDQLTASALVELAQQHNLTIPGVKEYDDGQAPKTLGLHLGRVFKENDTLNLDAAYQVVRISKNVKKDDGGYNSGKAYVFFKSAASRQNPSSSGSASSSSGSGSGDQKPGTEGPCGDPNAQTAASQPISTASPLPVEKHPSTSGLQVPHYQWDTRGFDPHSAAVAGTCSSICSVENISSVGGVKKRKYGW